MRTIALGLLLTVAGCASETPAPVVSWQYGTDGVTYPAPAGTYKWGSNGVETAPIAMTDGAYDPNGTAGTRVVTAPTAPSQVLAAPVPAPNPAQPTGHL